MAAASVQDNPCGKPVFFFIITREAQKTIDKMKKEGIINIAVTHCRIV